jgi:6-phosphogluconolactonase
VTRVTLTLPVLNAARHILFLVSGAAKAHRVAEVLQAPTASAALPASLIRPAAGEVTWLIDRAAAARL